MNAETINNLVVGVTKKWAKQRKTEERRASSASRRRDVMTASYRTTVKDAAYEVMEEAYLKASSGGTLPAHARQIMYAARGQVQEETGRRLDDRYFTQQLLPEYMMEHPSETGAWDVVFDARGHFTEPHTGRSVPLGTLGVRHYLREVDGHGVAELAVDTAGLGTRYPTRGPDHRFGAILFIEKEGFMPLLAGVKLAERYDVALMSTKGLSTTASRWLVDDLCGQHRIPLLVLRDFDKAGFSIAATLQRDTRRYEFSYNIEVIDLGLRLEDVEACGLESEDVHYGKSDPTWNLRENDATPAEVEFLVASGYPYRGRRVELNAFTSGDLVEWIESKLELHGVQKVVPDSDALEAAYRRAIQIQHVNAAINDLFEAGMVKAKKADVPADLTDRLRAALRGCPEKPWDEALLTVIAGENGSDS